MHTLSGVPGEVMVAEEIVRRVEKVVLDQYLQTTRSTLHHYNHYLRSKPVSSLSADVTSRSAASSFCRSPWKRLQSKASPDQVRISRRREVTRSGVPIFLR